MDMAAERREAKEIHGAEVKTKLCARYSVITIPHKFTKETYHV
jgi:hypothetical protein